MDYAREELLRQRRVLAFLLLRERPSREDGADPAETPEGTEAPELLERAPGAAGAERTAGGASRTRRAGPAPEPEARETAEAGPSGRGSRREAAMGRDRPGRRRTWREAVSPGSAVPARTGGGTAAIGSVAPGVPTAGGGTDARALSRAVQRDARRYDGGFAIR